MLSPKNFKFSSLKLCTPIDIPLTPDLESIENFSDSILVGLASIVISILEEVRYRLDM